MKSDIDIQKWVCHMIKGTTLEKIVTGKLSDRGRPNGSEDEDIVVAVLANDGGGDIQTCYVNVNIYVKDQWNSETKAWEIHTIRVQQLCEATKFLHCMFEGDFRVVSQNSSQRILPLGAEYEDGHTEHVINNKLFIRISND